MAADELRMPATVVDGFSGPLKALNDLLTRVGSNPAAKNVAKDWGGVSTQINKVSTDLRSQLQPALAGIGVASLGIGGAIGAAVGAIKNFAFNTREMNLFSRQIGLSVDQLRQLKAVGERFGLDWNAAQGSLKAFAGNMDQLQRRWGEAYGKLRAMNLGDLAEDLFSARDMNTAIEKALDGIRKIQNPVRRREVAQLLFGSDQWATIASEATPAVLAEIRKLTAAVTPEMQKASDQFVKNWHDMEQAVDGFVVRTLGPQLPKITGMLGDLNKAIEAFQNKGFLDGLKALDQMTPEVFNPNAGIEGVGPADPTYHKRQRADDLRRQIENADGQIGLIEGRGGDSRTARARRDELSEQLRRLTDELKALRGTGGGAQVSPMSFDGGGGMAGLIHRASLGGGGGFGGSPFSAGFWSNVYRGGVGGDPFRGGGRTWDRAGGGGDGGSSGGGAAAPEVRPTAGTPRLTPSAGGANRLGLNRVDERLQDIVKEATRYLPDGFSAKIISGYRPGDPRRHGQGLAMDVQLYDAKGKALPNYQDEGAFRTYEQLAQAAKKIQTEKYPELNKAFAWGGYFSGGRGRYGAVDTMHFDLGGQMGGGSWAGGLTPAQRALWPGARSVGMGSVDAYRLPSPGDPRLSSASMWPSGSSGAGRPFGADPVELERRRAVTEGAGRSGDSMMARAFAAGGLGGGVTKMESTGSVTIHLTGGLEKAPARVSMDGLFRDVKVHRKPQLADSGDGAP